MDRFVDAHSGQDATLVLSESCQVVLSKIEVMADIGAFAREFGVLQPLQIDVALTVVPPARDELSQAFDYGQIQSLAMGLAAERTVLIESFALRLARLCLANDLVLKAEVRIGKPQAIPGCMAGTSVVLSKQMRPT